METNSIQAEDLETIKEWLRSQPHLPYFLDDQLIQNFLKISKFSLEKCKRKLEAYFTIRSSLPKFFADRDICLPELQEMMKYAYAFYLPSKTPDGKKVGIAGTTTRDFETGDIANYFKMVFMNVDLRLLTEEMDDTDEVYVLDASVIIPRHYFKISVTDIRDFLRCLQTAYPNKLREVHVVNATPFIYFLLNFVQPLLDERLSNCINLHPSLESLHQVVPKEILPEEFGGGAGKIEELLSESVKALIACRPLFEKEEEEVIKISQEEDVVESSCMLM